MVRSGAMFCAAILVTALAGCVLPHHHAHRAPAPVVVHAPGPPPHAPAHGYRQKHRQHDLELVFDSGFGVYVVVGWENHFFHQDRFYRLFDGHWEISTRIDGGWASIRAGDLPKGLAKKRGHAKRLRRSEHPAQRAH